MHITIGLPSRGRPLELAASIYGLQRTRSFAHDVEYRVGHDNDDHRTTAVVGDMVIAGLPVVSSIGERALGLGEIHNRLEGETPTHHVFMLWSDRLSPITMHWDDIIAQSVMQVPHRVLWFNSHHLNGPCQFILPPLWRANLEGAPTPGLFPFWFEDTHVEEIDLLVHGAPYMRVDAMAAGPRTERTTRMRDLVFWIQLFAALRDERVRQACMIARKLGVPWGDKSVLIQKLRDRDSDFIVRAPALTEQYSAPGEPDETYLHALARGQRIMEELEDAPRSEVA